MSEIRNLRGQICRRLDGIPLALELAGARVSAMTIEMVASRLDQQFRLHVVGDPTVLPRQQTLRSTIDWSYELLDDPEKWLWRRLAVFAGGFTLAEADFAFAKHESQGRDIVELVTRLVDKSLVVMEERDGDVRYRLLEPLRQDCCGKLVELGEIGPARDQYLAWCLALARKDGSYLSSTAEKDLVDHLDRELDNLRDALNWCQAGDGHEESGLILAVTLRAVWSGRGLVSEGRRQLNRLLALWRQSPRAESRASPLGLLGLVAAQRGDFPQARAMLDELLVLASANGDTVEESRAYFFLGMVAQQELDLERAEELPEKSVALRFAANREQLGAYPLFELGTIALIRGDRERAKGLYWRCLGIWRAYDDPIGLALALAGLSWGASGQGQPSRAARLSGAAASLRDKSGLTIRTVHHGPDDDSTALGKRTLGDAAWQGEWDHGYRM